VVGYCCFGDDARVPGHKQLGMDAKITVTK